MPLPRTELVHDPGLDLAGPRLERTAVRGVVRRGDRLLMIRSRAGDLAFPGGGVEPGETQATALRRELLEECGLPAVTVGAEVATIVEHRPAREPDIAVFTMTSHYFLCSSPAELGRQRLEGYEADLGITPVWVSFEQALVVNEAARAAGRTPYYVARETLALRLLASRVGVAGGDRPAGHAR